MYNVLVHWLLLLGYLTLRKRVRTGGLMGVKAYFWGALCGDVEGEEGAFKVFHGRQAPNQSW